jgi:hypothetical protein
MESMSFRFYTDNVYLLDENMNTIKKNIEMLLYLSNEADLEKQADNTSSISQFFIM